MRRNVRRVAAGWIDAGPPTRTRNFQSLLFSTSASADAPSPRHPAARTCPVLCLDPLDSLVDFATFLLLPDIGTTGRSTCVWSRWIDPGPVPWRPISAASVFPLFRPRRLVDPASRPFARLPSTSFIAFPFLKARGPLRRRSLCRYRGRVGWHPRSRWIDAIRRLGRAVFSCFCSRRLPPPMLRRPAISSSYPPCLPIGSTPSSYIPFVFIYYLDACWCIYPLYSYLTIPYCSLSGVSCYFLPEIHLVLGMSSV
ncbi:hypothetical protein B0H10DRAFT_699012 [Mycena sp. CBHHK59/15]|nr:hypothetical protein B0H10DRAFT_699012 [Mycena sp. CBHHK59/15]